ncbi:ECF transporter S component [Lactobacillus sp. PV034]|uniref:ECF transporter S component n=1 Tax=Lactobacillus sp. PV034 TaxID=2594495 RepID=UPI002240A714|nr:ECF transporter S component [Lactobacillus sp. PV034]QNQ80486.1 ECF transporter S component [Lactobacillus sp. PV034]
MKSYRTSQDGLKYWLVWAMVGAIAFLVMQIEIPIIPGIDYLKFDVSDVIVAIATMIFGIFGGTMVALFKILLKAALSGFNPLSVLGDLTSFIATLAYIYPFYLIAKKGQLKLKSQIIGLIIGTICLTVVMAIANFFLMPLYFKVVGLGFNKAVINAIVVGVIPFNLIKGVINGILIILLMKSVYPTLNHFVKSRF